MCNVLMIVLSISLQSYKKICKPMTFEPLFYLSFQTVRVSIHITLAF